MDLIDLPVADANMSLEDALAMMRHKKSGGVISHADLCTRLALIPGLISIC